MTNEPRIFADGGSPKPGAWQDAERALAEREQSVRLSAPSRSERIVKAAVAWQAAHAAVAPRIPDAMCECGHHREDHSHGGGAYCERCKSGCQRFREASKADRDRLINEARSVWQNIQTADAELRDAVDDFRRE